MKFIYPQNYNFTPKILGILEYSAAILDLIWGSFIYLIISIFVKNLNIKIFAIIILVFPVLIFSIVGVQGESLIYFLKYMIKYAYKQKIYFYE